MSHTQTDLCTPPVGTPDGTWHWLRRYRIHPAELDTLDWKVRWDSNGYWVGLGPAETLQAYPADRLGRADWRYIGPVEEPAPVKAESADTKAVAPEKTTRNGLYCVYGACKGPPSGPNLTCSPACRFTGSNLPLLPTVIAPSASDALLREAVFSAIDAATSIKDGLRAIDTDAFFECLTDGGFEIARIRQHLGEKT